MNGTGSVKGGIAILNLRCDADGTSHAMPFCRCKGKRMRVAIVQMTSGIDPLTNAATVADAARQAAAGGAVMLFAPEMAGLIDRDRTRAAAHVVGEANNGYIAACCSAARDHRIWIHCGSVPVLDDEGSGKWRNRSLVINADGVIRARYDKIHLFDVDLPTGESWRESSAYAAGGNAVVADTPIGPMGLTICYDLRFPTLFGMLADAGARVIVVPSAFTVPTGEAHWHILLRARAIETSSWVIAAAQCGNHADGRTTYGHSLVIDPWGRIVLDMGSEAGVGFAEIDDGITREVRDRIPVLSHRRPINLAE
jgi:deaminated glutathione amidase